MRRSTAALAVFALLATASLARAQAFEHRVIHREVLAVDRLPFVEPSVAAETFVQRLKEPTEHGENVLVHLELPAPANRALRKSLVRVLGDPESPVVLFSSDALAKLGKIDESPGPGFFTAFMQLDEREIERRLDAEKRLESIGDGKSTLVFRGRSPVAVTTSYSRHES